MTYEIFRLSAKSKKRCFCRKVAKFVLTWYGQWPHSVVYCQSCLTARTSTEFESALRRLYDKGWSKSTTHKITISTVESK